MVRSSLVTALLAAASTAGTYVLMHFVVQPRLPVERIEVPSIQGLTVEQARGLLDPKGLNLVLDGERPDDKVAAGTLTGQAPLRGSLVHHGAEVHASVATAGATQVVPKVVGMTLADARGALVAAHLHPGSVAETPSDAVAAGQVLAAVPPPGTTVKADAVVDLTVSTGPSTAPVPSLIGKRLSRAKEILQQAGFAVGATRYGSNDDFDTGVVIGQSPSASTPAARGAKVDVILNE